MKFFITLFSLFVAFLSINAQGISNMSFGTDSTFEVITWNIEHFPKNGQTTIDYVKQAIIALDADVYAVQEITDTAAFTKFVSELDNYKGFYNKDNYYHITIGYIYKKDLQINNIYPIYSSYSYSTPFPRRPLVMDLTYDNKNIIVINNHLKASEHGDDGIIDFSNSDDNENRRYQAIRLLKEYIDQHFANKSVIVVGDMNDELTDGVSGNVFQLMLDDPKNYKYADMTIAEGPSSNWSYPSWPSHLDHILVTNELFDELNEDVAKVQTMKVDEYMSSWSSYDNNISDHRPVAMKIVPNNFVAINETNQKAVSFSNFPNPFISSTEFVFDQIEQNTELCIYNSIGKIVLKQKLSNGQKNMVWNSNNLPNGIYFAGLFSKNKLISKTTLIKN